MKVDLDAEAVDLGVLPRFQRAAFQARRLGVLAAWLGAIALSMLLGMWFVPDSLWRPLLGNNGAALLLLAAGLHSARVVALWRLGATEVPSSFSPPVQGGRVGRLMQRIGRFCKTVAQRIGSEVFEALWLGVPALAALLSVIYSWNLALTGASLGQFGYVAGGAALLAAFGLLVLERYLAGSAEAEWPEGSRLAQLVRVAIVTALLSALCLFGSSERSVWPARLAVLAGALPALVAIELLLRAALSWFSRRGGRLEPRLLADSFVANLLQWPPRPLQALQDELHNRFGIDLRQNWAFSYMRRALLPVLSLVLAIGWLLSGIREIPIDGRAIYERFGAPVAVWEPGLHAGLPWPLSRLRPVENGTIHMLATSLPGDDSSAPDSSTAEGLAPASANRLWDKSHVSEKSQVIASRSGDRQSFQVVYMDVRFVYRIALTREAAMASVYNGADIPTLIRSSASRVLVRDFASRTLDGVLAEQRAVLAGDIGKAVQADLDALASGVEILSTLIESFHPPSGAANAYHSVQAAQIKAQATIARERGRAAEQLNEAQLQASMADSKATASAREINAGAEIAQRRFAAEQDAYRSGGKAFVLEQYLNQLGQGLANAQLVIVDHRIAGDHAPTIDLRSYATPGTSP